MPLFVLSFNYNSASLSVRERVAFASPERLNEAYNLWKTLHPSNELVLLSTCNRVELYAAAEDENQLSSTDLPEFVMALSGMSQEQIRDSAVLYEGLDVANHLYRVTSGLESIAFGESQIVAQVKSGYEQATAYDSTGPLLHRLFQTALSTSAEVRSSTLVSNGRVSIASVAINDCVKGTFSNLVDKKVLIVGAGVMAREALTYLESEGVQDLEIVNRTFENAAELAERFGATAFPFAELDCRLASADIIITATSSASPIINRLQLDVARGGNQHRHVCIVDLAAPRNVSPRVRLVDNVSFFDLDDLETTVRQNGDLRNSQIRQAQEIINGSIKSFDRFVRERSLGDVVRETREQAVAIANRELQALFRKPLGFDQSQSDAIEQAALRIVNKVLHNPIKALKQRPTVAAQPA